jgi:hypothetical protein
MLRRTLVVIEWTFPCGCSQPRPRLARRNVRHPGIRRRARVDVSAHQRSGDRLPERWRRRRRWRLRRWRFAISGVPSVERPSTRTSSKSPCRSAGRRCRGKHAGSPPRYCVDRHPGWVISDWTAPSIMRPRTPSRPVDEPEVMTDTPEVAYAHGK